MSSDTRRPLLAIVTGTRAEYGLLQPLIQHLRKRKRVRVVLLVTGMHTLKAFGATMNEVGNDRMPIGSVIPIATADDMVSALAKEIIGIRAFVKRTRPDGILVTGDRDEGFAGATVAVHEEIPVIHISGGDVSGKTVDHALRNAITVFSSLHLTQTVQSRLNVLRLGAEPRHAVVVGSLGLDRLSRATLLSRQRVANALSLNPREPWSLIVHHPTPFDDVPIVRQITPVLEIARTLPGERIIVYPNSDSGGSLFIRTIRTLQGHKHIHLFTNIRRLHFVSLLAHSRVLIGNSSSGLMEAGHLNIPFINVGNRQGRRERGPNVIKATYSAISIRRALRRAESRAFRQRLRRKPKVYHGGGVVHRAATAIEHFLHTHHA